MKNKMSDLNNYLFAQLERLDDEEITDDELDAVINRGNAIADISAQIIAAGNLQLKAVKLAQEAGVPVDTPALLGLTVEGR